MQHCTWYLNVLCARPGLQGNAISRTTNGSIMFTYSNQGILYLQVRNKTSWCTHFEPSDKLIPCAIHHFMHASCVYFTCCCICLCTILYCSFKVVFWSGISLNVWSSLVEMDQVKQLPYIRLFKLSDIAFQHSPC